MSYVEVKHRHSVGAPRNETFAFKHATGILDPYLFAESTGDGGFGRRCAGAVAASAAGIVEATKARPLDWDRDRVIFPYRPGTSIKPRIAKKKTTLWSSRPDSVAAPIGWATLKNPPNSHCVSL